jgi:ABC-type multidrug transport system fused ATPase/permease subunit
MLAEIAAANAAFAVIKGALANGKELSALGSKVFDYFDNKAKIQEKVNKKGGGSDLEEFMALEQLRLQEEELRERMVYAGRPGMWNDWQKFQAAAARKRREAQEAEARRIALRKARIAQLIEYITLGIASLVLAAVLIYGIILYMLHLR